MSDTAALATRDSAALANLAPSGASLSTWLSPDSFEKAEKIASLMAKCGTLPRHLVDKPADCFRVVVQAAKWGMDPFAVAEHTSVPNGRLCYEGKLVHAVLLAMGAIGDPLDFEYNGKAGDELEITVTGKLRKSGLVKSIKGSVGKWKTSNPKWKEIPEMMLAYRGARDWARLYAPHAMMGVITQDEVEEIREVTGEVVPEAKPATARPLPDLRDDEDEKKQQQAKPAAVEPDPKATAALLVLDLQRRANEAHATFGKDGIAKIRLFCDRIGVKQIAECPPEKAAEAMEIWKTFERELHEGMGTAAPKGGAK